MKRITLLLLGICFLAAAIIGCASKNPLYTPPLAGQPNTNTVPEYVPDPRIAQWSNTVSTVTRGAAPVNPYAGLTDLAVNGVFGALGIISLLIARKKSAALQTVAAGVVKAGAAQAVIDHASNTPNFSAVANAINDQTGANQTNLGTPKT